VFWGFAGKTCAFQPRTNGISPKKEAKKGELRSALNRPGRKRVYLKAGISGDRPFCQGKVAKWRKEGEWKPKKTGYW